MIHFAASGAFFLFIILGVIIFVFIAYHAHRKTEERRLALTAFAAQRGWEFDPMKNRNIRHQFLNVELFERGADRYGENVIYGAHEGCEALMFDYHYETRSGKNSKVRHHHYGVVALRSPFLLKPLMVRPEGLWDKVTSAFGWDDIDFESAEFSRRYHVSGPDRRWAFDVINPRTMEVLMSRANVTLYLAHTHILVTKSGHLRPEEMIDGLVLCAAVLDGIPEFARESLT